MFRFPFTTFHELNLDWVLQVVKEAQNIFTTGRADIDHAVETAEQALTTAEQAASGVIGDGAVTTPKLANEAVTTIKMAPYSVTSLRLADDAVETRKISDSAVTTPKLADDAVTTPKLADDAVTTPKLADGAVTVAKLDSAITNSILTPAAAVSIPAEGQSAVYTLAGLTASHVVAFWGFTASSENDPPVSLDVTTAANTFTVINHRGTTSESFKPVFIKSII